MKYSLRSLMIGMTLFCVLLGGRIEYLRRWAVYHSTEYRRQVQSLAVHYHTSEERVDGLCESLERYGTAPSSDMEKHPCKAAIEHKRLARVYRQSRYQPWALVDEGTP